jgi:hypothetical protein
MTLAIEKKMDELDALEQMDNESVAHAVTDILCELARAERIHPVWPDGLGGQYNIVCDQGMKIRQDALNILADNEQASKKTYKRHLIQTAAMCIRCLKNMEAA